MASSPSKGKSNSKRAQNSGPKAGPSASKQKARAAALATQEGPKASAGMTGAEKVMWICLHLLVFLVPIAMSNMNWLAQVFPNSPGFALPLTYDQFDIVKVFIMRAFALGALGAWSFQFFFKGGKLRRTKLDWLIVGFLGWVLFTSFT